MPDREYLSVVSWEQVHADVYALARSILEADVGFDALVGIGYGGIIPATLMYFALPETRFRIAYPSKSKHAFIEALEGIEGRRVLLVDDLAITGDSLSEIREEVLRQGASAITTACLYCSENYDALDFFVRRLEPAERVVFPWYTVTGDHALKVFKYKDRFGKHEPLM
jgi:hypothetical protein